MSVRTPLPLVTAALFAMACQKAEQPKGASEAVPSQSTPSSPAPAAHEVTVIAKDFAFDAPATVPAGVTTFRLDNQGKAIHHVQILKFEQGKTLNDFLAALKKGGPPPAWAVEVGGPNAPAPGGSSVATVPLEQGSYAFVCFVDVPDHVPHIMKGMSRPFTVTADSAAPAAEPASDVTVTLADYGFTFSKPLTAGTHTIKVDNKGAQPHEIEIIQLDSGKTMDDLIKWAANYQGAPPGRPVGGMTGIAPGRHGYFTVDLPAGNYGVICFYPDMKDGKPHFMHGMKQQITIS